VSDRVGPILHAGPRADALIAAIRAENRDVEVLDRGAYVRVSAPGRCKLTRAAVERFLGEPFELPSDLEAMMSSFAGRIAIDDAEVIWSDATERGDRS
jgi:toluene monooxygenase system protein D